MELRDVKDINGVLKYADFLQSDRFNDERKHADWASFRTVDGKTQIHVAADFYEPGYEDFSTTVRVYENGRALFVEDAANVGAYHNEPYTQSQFDTLDKAKNYLMQKYDGVEFVPTKDQLVHDRVNNEFPVKWEDPAYAASLNPPTRLVFENQGTVQTKDGDTLHKVAFAYACDRKTFGRDESISNPYLVNRKDANGVNHAVLLSDNLYNALMGMANREGMDRSRWSGVIQADVVQMKDGSMTANLTDEAIRNRRVKTPVKMFDEAEHNSFIKSSLQEAYRDQKEDRFTIVGPNELEQRMKPDNVKDDNYHPMVDMMREWRPEPKVVAAGKTQSPPSTVRLVYEELPYEDPNPSPTGERFHKVAFAIACDQKTPGVDAPLGNPYLTNRPKDDPQGSHGVLLSEEAYQRLVNATNKQGTEGTRWAGVVDAHLVRTESREHMVPDLSADAEKSGRLLVPTEPFDAEKHDEFVKQSLRQLSKYGQPGKAVAQRIYGEPREGRALPDIELVPSAETPEMQAGE